MILSWRHRRYAILETVVIFGTWEEIKEKFTENLGIICNTTRFYSKCSYRIKKEGSQVKVSVNLKEQEGDMPWLEVEIYWSLNRLATEIVFKSSQYTRSYAV